MVPITSLAAAYYSILAVLALVTYLWPGALPAPDGEQPQQSITGDEKLVSSCASSPSFAPHQPGRDPGTDAPSSPPPQPAAARTQSEPGWKLACELDAPYSLRCHVRMDSGSGWLAVRFDGAVCATLSECMCLLREVDLWPRWLSLVTAAAVTRVVSQTELCLFADLGFWPWPLPAHYAFIRVRADVGRGGVDGAPVVLHVESPPLGHGAGAEPAPSVRAKHRIPLKELTARLTTAGAAAATSGGCAEGCAEPCARAEGQATLELRKLTFLGPAAAGLAHLPEWLLRLLFRIVVPHIWRKLSDSARAVHARPAEHARRLEADATGVYALVDAAAGQPRRRVCAGGV